MVELHSGFFNSLEGTQDRRYNAEDMGRMFDGLITEGIFSAVGGAFVVTSVGGLNITVETGRAWFSHIWMINETVAQITLDDIPPMIESRYDAVILEINKKDAERRCMIKVVSGDIVDNVPEKPEMIHSGGIDQYALCYITRHGEDPEVTQADIENVIGTEETPFVTGLLQQLDIQTLLTQWDAQWQQEQAEHMQGYQDTFEEWFSHLQDELDEQQAAHLQHQIDDINDFLGNIGNAEDIPY